MIFNTAPSGAVFFGVMHFAGMPDQVNRARHQAIQMMAATKVDGSKKVARRLAERSVVVFIVKQNKKHPLRFFKKIINRKNFSQIPFDVRPCFFYRIQLGRIRR